MAFNGCPRKLCLVGLLYAKIVFHKTSPRLKFGKVCEKDKEFFIFYL